jgi:hypothetical protein
MRRSLWLAVLALLIPIAALVSVVAAEVREPDAPAPPAPTVAPTATPAVALTPPAPPAAGPGLAVGVTEFNANLVASPAERALPAPWAAMRDALGALRPQFFRLVIDWSSLQPSPDAPANLDAPQAGCSRTVKPCLEWHGVRDQLRALASRQREGGWEALAVIAWTPPWAAMPAGGCERPDTPARARPPRADALGAYRALVAAVLAAAEQEGARLRYWSPWNEPNHPGFISPQRAACDAATTSNAPAAYADLARSLAQTLGEAPGDQQLVVGETAGLLKATRYVSSVPEFIAGLPKDVVCASTVWSQHAYVGGDDPVDAAATALAARGCPQPHTIWITETGVGAAPRDLSAADAITDEQVGCRALRDRLVRWWHDPRVTVAFQYTFREDEAFPTGLVSSDLTRTRPALAEWTAWGGGRDPAAPPPAAAC